MPLDQNPHQTVTLLGASAFQRIRAGFLCHKCDNFACLRTRQDQIDLYLKISKSKFLLNYKNEHFIHLLSKFREQNLQQMFFFYFQIKLCTKKNHNTIIL